MTVFSGLSAFPLTPLREDKVDETAFTGFVEHLAASGVDSVTVLGSTGSYAYLTTGERARVADLAVRHAGTTPVVVGVGALRTSQVLDNVRAAEDAGAAGVLLAPVSYQPLTHDDVFELFRTVTGSTRLPVVVYDNPGTTHFGFTDGLLARVAALPGIASLKIPAVPADTEAARNRITALRAVIPEHVSIGVSGDATAVHGLLGGCDAWYSVIGGTLPDTALEITRAVQDGRDGDALRSSRRLTPLWDLFAEHGSLRVIAAVAEQLGTVQGSCLPLPVRGLGTEARRRVADALRECGLI